MLIIFSLLTIGQIIITPNNGHELGGTVVIIKGPCFENGGTINCTFGSVTVPGVRVSRFRAMCISPMFGNIASPIDFTLQINGSNINSIVKFYLRKCIVNNVYYIAVILCVDAFTDLSDVRMISNDYRFLVQSGNSTELQWNPSSLLPLAANDQFNVSISLYRLNVVLSSNFISSATTIDHLSNLLTNLNNSGTAMVTIPSFSSSWRLVPFLFKVNIALDTNPTSNNSYLQALYELYNGHSTVNNAGIWSHLIIWWDGTTGLCSVWHPMLNFDFWQTSASSSFTDLPPCPCNITQADLLNSGFEPNTSPGRRLMDQFLHNGSVCYLSSKRVDIT